MVLFPSHNIIYKGRPECPLITEATGAVPSHLVIVTTSVVPYRFGWFQTPKPRAERTWGCHWSMTAVANGRCTVLWYCGGAYIHGYLYTLRVYNIYNYVGACNTLPSSLPTIRHGGKGLSRINMTDGDTTAVVDVANRYMQAYKFDWMLYKIEFDYCSSQI